MHNFYLFVLLFGGTTTGMFLLGKVYREHTVRIVYIKAIPPMFYRWHAYVHDMYVYNTHI